MVLKNIKLSEREFRILTNRIKNRYARTKDEERNYTYKDVENLFIGTDIDKDLSTKIINEELKKTRSYKNIKKEEEIRKKLIVRDKSNRSIKEKILFSLGGILVSSLIISMGFCTLEVRKDEDLKKRFREAYSSKLVMYADTNKDGIISNKEKEEFGYRILNGKNSFQGKYIRNRGFLDYLEFYPYWPETQPGQQVSLKELTKWLEEYNK